MTGFPTVLRRCVYRDLEDRAEDQLWTFENLMEKRLRDPGSYERIEWTWHLSMDTIRHRIRYRAKNALGGYVVKNATAEATLDTSHVELEMQ